MVEKTGFYTPVAEPEEPMTEPAVQKAAGPTFNGQLEPVDPKTEHDLIITVRCASEAAAHQIMHDIAAKMRVEPQNLDDPGENRSVPPPGTVIPLVTRGASKHQVGWAAVYAGTEPFPEPN